MQCRTKSYVVVGLGKTGLSCIRYLVHQEARIVVMDTRSDPPALAEFKMDYPNIPIYLGELNEAILLEADELIVSPGVSLQLPPLAKAIAKNIPVISDIELFVRAIKAPIIAITGTNAKGTVTTLVGEMVRRAGHKVLVGGNIGIPVLDLLIEPIPEFYVLELSSFQLETTYTLHPMAATILNISEDHLDRHGTMEAYIAAKQRIYQNCRAAVWNRDDQQTYPTTCSIDQKVNRQLLSFGLSKPNEGEFGIQNVGASTWLALGSQRLFPIKELFIKGRHNWANALAALALGHAIRLPMNVMLQTLRDFKGLPHRCEWVAECDNVIWYNDSKGTNVGASIAAIQGLGDTVAGKIVLIAGGLGKGADFSPLCLPVAKYVKAAVLIGKDAPLLAKVLEPITHIRHAINMEEAVAIAKKEACSGDAVLLSPACASFDMFRDFEDRGEIFKHLVRGLLS